MKAKLKRWIEKKPGLALVAGCYLLGLLCLLLWQLAGFAVNRVYYATGRLAPAQLTLEDFELYGCGTDGTQLWTQDADPQLVLKDGARLVENLQVELEYAYTPRQRTVFWAKGGQGYSVRRMAYSHGGEGRVYYLPAAGVQNLRFDPDSVPGNLITVKSISINQPRPFWAFFLISPVQLMALVMAPGLVASVLSVLREAKLWPKRRKAVAGNG